MLDDQQFQLKADESLRGLYKALAEASDEHDFETDFGGAVTVEFEDPPAKQIWVSALSKSYKLGWEDGRKEFVLAETGQTLKQVVQDAMALHLGKTIEL